MTPGGRDTRRAGGRRARRRRAAPPKAYPLDFRLKVLEPSVDELVVGADVVVRAPDGFEADTLRRVLQAVGPRNEA
jgi:hypothetical protein